MTAIRSLALALGMPAALLAIAGCHTSPYVDVTVNNQSGDQVRNVEVDYPGASFGHDTLANGAQYPYRFQPRGSGAVKAQFTDSAGHVHEATGPVVSEGQGGTLEIRFTPPASIVFVPNFVKKN